MCSDAADKIESNAKVIADLAAKCEVEFQARVEQAKVIAALREALETIAEPILHAERTAKASGERLNELAYQIYISPENLRAMARDALKKLNEQTAEK